jgi:hypothetical protein
MEPIGRVGGMKERKHIPLPQNKDELRDHWTNPIPLGGHREARYGDSNLEELHRQDHKLYGQLLTHHHGVAS